MEVSQLLKLASRAKRAQQDIDELSQVLIEVRPGTDLIAIGGGYGGPMWSGVLPAEDIAVIRSILERALEKRALSHSSFLAGIASEVPVPSECEQWKDLAEQR